MVQGIGSVLYSDFTTVRISTFGGGAGCTGAGPAPAPQFDRFLQHLQRLIEALQLTVDALLSQAAIP